MSISLVGGIVAGTVGAATAAAAVLAVVALGSPDGGPERPAAVTGAVVARVVDGDTVVMDNGDRVRLIGIDTPEHDRCGFAEATDALARLVEGRVVELVNPADVQDTDRYGRLLRYLDTGGDTGGDTGVDTGVDTGLDKGSVDAGYEQIEHGLARSRYDSVDGYDRHPRQAAYRALDKTTRATCAGPG